MLLLRGGDTGALLAGGALVLAGLAAVVLSGAVARPGGRRAYANRVRRIVSDSLLELRVAGEGERAHAAGLAGAERIHRRLRELRVPRGLEAAGQRHVAAAAAYADAYRELDAVRRAGERERVAGAVRRAEDAQVALVRSVSDEPVSDAASV